MIYLAFKHLEAAAEGDEFTEYHLQAAIAACHAAASRYELTDWAEIVRLYDLLVALNPPSVVALNRAVAVAKWKGPEAGIRRSKTSVAIQLCNITTCCPPRSANCGRNGRRDQSRRFLSPGVEPSLLGARAAVSVEAARSYGQGLNRQSL